MAKPKSNDANNQKLGPEPHRKATRDQNAELNRLKRDPEHIQKNC